MRNDIKFRPMKLPKLNKLLGVEDDIDFRFVYMDFDTPMKDFYYTGLYRIKDNKLLYSDEIPFSESGFSVNSLMDKSFVGIKISNESMENEK